MKAREARFLGLGNFAIGEGHSRIKAWKLICPRCEEIKVIAMPHANMPPDAVIKKFTQAGWYVAKRPQDDLCGDCQKKQRSQINGSASADTFADINPAAHEKEVSAALTKAIEASKREKAALLQVLEDQLLFRRLHELLTQRLIDDAMQAIEARLPGIPWPKRNPATKPAAAKADEYDQWLDDLQKQHSKASHQ